MTQCSAGHNSSRPQKVSLISRCAGLDRSIVESYSPESSLSLKLFIPEEICRTVLEGRASVHFETVPELPLPQGLLRPLPGCGSNSAGTVPLGLLSRQWPRRRSGQGRRHPPDRRSLHFEVRHGQESGRFTPTGSLKSALRFRDWRREPALARSPAAGGWRRRRLPSPLAVTGWVGNGHAAPPVPENSAPADAVVLAEPGAAPLKSWLSG